jgi:hypothetical protein
VPTSFVSLVEAQFGANQNMALPSLTTFKFVDPVASHTLNSNQLALVLSTSSELPGPKEETQMLLQEMG